MYSVYENYASRRQSQHQNWESQLRLHTQAYLRYLAEGSDETERARLHEQNPLGVKAFQVYAMDNDSRIAPSAIKISKLRPYILLVKQRDSKPSTKSTERVASKLSSAKAITAVHRLIHNTHVHFGCSGFLDR